MRRPGHWLRAAAACVCATRTMERVVDPIVADIQTEHDGALRAGHRWRAAWVRINGYCAFWKAVGLHTILGGRRACWSSIAADGWALGRTMVYFLCASVSITLLLSAEPMINHYSRVPLLKPMLLLLPEAIPVSLPIALSLGIVCSVDGSRLSARRVRGVLVLAAGATLFALAVMVSRPMVNQGFHVAMAKHLESRGVKYSPSGGVHDLSLSELATASRKHDAGGFSETARRFRRTYHFRFAFPAATFVLSLLALGICSFVPYRAARVSALVLALGGYYVLLVLAESKFSTTVLPPMLSVWMPNLVCAAVSLALLKIAAVAPSPGTQPTSP